MKYLFLLISCAMFSQELTNTISDKLVINNAYFKSKTLVAELDEKMKVFKDNNKDLYYVIDFSKLKED